MAELGNFDAELIFQRLRDQMPMTVVRAGVNVFGALKTEQHRDATQRKQTITNLVRIEPAEEIAVQLNVGVGGNRSKPRSRFQLAEPPKAALPPRGSAADPNRG